MRGRIEILSLALVCTVGAAGAQLPLPPDQRRLAATGNAVGVSSFGFCDDQMGEADWTSQLVVASPPASPGFVATVAAAGGNPAQHERIQLLPSGNGMVKVAHWLTNEKIDPAVDGGVVDIAGTMDVRKIAGNKIVQVALLVEQDGSFFVGPAQPVANVQWTGLSWSNLSAASFANVIPGGRPSAPSFDCGSRPIRIGFLTSVAITNRDRPQIGVDNWCVTVRTRCCLSNEGKPLGRSCCDEPLEVDKGGNFVLPADADDQVKPDVDVVNEFTGPVGSLYPDLNTSTDLWYGEQPCDSCIGGTIPADTANPDIGQMLHDAGIDARPEDIRDVVDATERTLIEQVESTERISFPDLSAISAPYVPTHLVHKLGDGPFRQRDIVFVHGLDTDAIMAKLDANNPHHDAASASWVTPTLFNVADFSENPEYYRDGYFKKQANAVWSAHIQHYFADKGFKNRYLIVAYNSNDRMEVAVQEVLRQVADAMKFGEGVVDPLHPNDPNWVTPDFGKPSLVFVNWSTGGPLTDIALAAAASHPNLGVGFIPEHTKAVIAAHGVFSGSRYASAALVVSGLLAAAPPWACALAKRALEQFGVTSSGTCGQASEELVHSILVDLVPVVMQIKWGPYIALSPARTLTVAGAHPSQSNVLKYVLQPGYDDGVSNVNSQIAHPSPSLVWPTGFGTSNLFRAYDMPLAFPSGAVTISLPAGLGTVSIQSNMRNSPRRATGYFIDQVIDRHFAPLSAIVLPPQLIASGPIPWISPTGMRQPADGLLPGPWDPLLRVPRHYSYLFTASDHFKGTSGSFGGFNFPWYADTGGGERNDEETRAITDPTIFLQYSVGNTNDNAALLSSAPQVNEYRRGLRVRYRLRFSRRWRERWVWSRRYYLLNGWESLTQFDYVYDRVLQ